MKLPDGAHFSRRWRIHEIAYDFDLEDVWALPTPGGPDDFPRLLELFASFDPERDAGPAVRALFALRWAIGGLMGWDETSTGLRSRVPSLGDRLPDDLRDGASGPDLDNAPFESLYGTDDEWAAEIANSTVHGVLHLGWVPDGAGGYSGQMAVLVKPNGRLGKAYMAGITPFRHLVVYPTMLRAIGAKWRAATPA